MPAALFVAQPQPSVLAEPSVSALHHVTELAQPAAMCLAWFGEERRDPALPGPFDVDRSAVGSISLEQIGLAARATSRALDGRKGIKQGQGGLGIMNIGWSDLHRQRNALRVGQDMPLAALFRSVRGVRTGVVPPKTARTDWLSMTARERSTCPARPSTLTRRW